MRSPKKLHNLLHQDMRNPTFPFSKYSPPDSSLRCHYTLQFYACTHKSFLIHPRINHVAPCPFSPSLFPSLDYLKGGGGHQETKRRCENMADKPLEVYLNEVCAKCRPSSLGTGNLKQLRAFEPVISETAKIGKVKVAGMEKKDEKNSSTDGGLAEIEKAFSDLSPQNPQQPPSAAESHSEKTTETGIDPVVEKTLESQSKRPESPTLNIQIPPPETILEQPTDSTADTHKSDIQEKNQRWGDVDVNPTAKHGEPALSGATKTSRWLFSRLFKPLGGAKNPEEGGRKDEGKDKKTGPEGAFPGQIQEGSRSEPPDWEEVSDDDRQEKLWKDDGEWVDVKEES